MPRLPRPRLADLHRRAVLVVGVLMAVLGALGALVHGPDDTVMLGEQVQPAPSAGLPTVVHPVSTAFGGAELVVRAEAPGGLFLGATHRVDVTDLLDGLRYVEQDSLGMSEPTFVEGFEVALAPDPLLGWWERSSGTGVREVRVDLDGPPVDVLAVPVEPRAPVTMSLGVHVDGIFTKALAITGFGLGLVLLWALGRRASRGVPSVDSPPHIDHLGEVPAVEPEPVPDPEPQHEPQPEPEPESERESLPAAEPVPAAKPAAVPVVEPAAATPPAHRPAPGQARPSPAVGAGVAVGVAALALGGWVRWRRARRRGTTFLLLLALLLGGCGLAPDGDDSDQKPGLEPRVVDELLADYTTRRTRAARRASAPRYDGALWVKAQTGSLVASSQWQAIADRIERNDTPVPRPVLAAEAVHAPLFRDYPMWGAVEVKEQGGGRQLVVFTRERFAEPWLATAAVDVGWGVVPEPDPSPEPVDRAAFEAGAAAAELVDAWWEDGSSAELIVDDLTEALRDELVPLFYPPEVVAWPDADQRRFLVAVDGGSWLLVTVHSMTIGTRSHALTSLVLLPSVGRPRVLASTVRRTLR
ncbi:hypothetical protein [Nocardioides solisilvae]|uniref:hypothetical protein n=1 Tax=Nocardioides solisilvae TaxID=1542435 RepID=UPI0013A5B39B|nr:hypothetical protein [Nocardioides solisilvae]